MKRSRIASLATLAIVFFAGDTSVAGFTRKSIRHNDKPLAVLVLDGTPVHTVGELLLHTGNWGGFGSWPGSGQPFSTAPSARWPSGLAVEYLFLGGLWIGGVRSGVPAVSTAGSELEMRPSPDPIDIVYRSALGAVNGTRYPFPGHDDDGDGSIDEDRLDGRDNDLDSLIDEDFAGVSGQMFSRVYTDDQPAATQIYPMHNPFQLTIHEESYQWEHDDFDDFVGFTYRVFNHGTNVITDAYIGVFIDPDVGNRSTPSYWEDDAVGSRLLTVDHGAHGTRQYRYYYGYDADGDGGTVGGMCGIILLDHTTDPTGVNAPTMVGASSVSTFNGTSSYASGGMPTNDFERYESLSSGTIQGDQLVPRDYRGVIAAGPFRIAPGQSIMLSTALAAGPNGDFSNVTRAAEAYHGAWFDRDENPGTGVDGKEHQEHWYIPSDLPPVTPVFITYFDARTVASVIMLEWETYADEPVAGFKLYRSENGGAMLPLIDELLPSDTRTFTDASVVPGRRYEYVLEAHAASGWSGRSAPVSAMVMAQGVSLGQNYPNPFNPKTTISFTIDAPSQVTLSIYTADGRLVATLVDRALDAGAKQVSWDGRDASGEAVGSGVYFYRITVDERSIAKKMVLLK